LDVTIDLQRIDQIAEDAHRGQFRKFTGLPYIEHPRAVAARLETDEDKAVALLHDTLEDTDLTAAKLLALAVPQDIVESVMVLTRGEETYGQFLDRVLLSGDKRAVRVKIEDIQHNLSDLPLGNGLRARYEAGLRRLGHVA
jgi:(p)ppGpp synthase/HD superfamily hydrolase